MIEQITSTLGPKEKETLEAAYGWRLEKQKSDVCVVADVTEMFLKVFLNVYSRIWQLHSLGTVFSTLEVTALGVIVVAKGFVTLSAFFLQILQLQFCLLNFANYVCNEQVFILELP